MQLDVQVILLIVHLELLSLKEHLLESLLLLSDLLQQGKLQIVFWVEPQAELELLLQIELLSVLQVKKEQVVQQEKKLRVVQKVLDTQLLAISYTKNITAV
jgi:hypothetical protein